MSRIFNLVGTSGAWFSPFGWRARAVLLRGKCTLEWVDVTMSRLKEATASFGTSTTPLLLLADGEQLKDSKEIARWIDSSLFPAEHQSAISLFEVMIDVLFQVPGFGIFSSLYLQNGVIAGDDLVPFEALVERATGKKIAQHGASFDVDIVVFRQKFKVIEKQLSSGPWVLGSPFTYADVLLFTGGGQS